MIMRALGKAIAIATILTMASATGLAASLFENPGFETGDFTGWNISYIGGHVDGTLTGLSPGATGGGTGHEDAVVVPLGWATDPYTSNTVEKVQFGNYSARIGDANNQIDHAGTGSANDDPYSVILSQTGTLTQPLQGVVIAWMAAVTEPANREDHEHAGTPEHPGFPHFSILVKNETTGDILLYETHSSEEGIGPGYWTQGPAQGSVNDLNNLYLPTRDPNTPGDWFYHDWAEVGFSLDGVPLGTQISIVLTVADCALRGHPAYARLDLFEVPPSPPPEVPEPGTVALLLVGMAAAGWYVRHRRAA
jgi:hypothetical protein